MIGAQGPITIRATGCNRRVLGKWVRSTMTTTDCGPRRLTGSVLHPFNWKYASQGDHRLQNAICTPGSSPFGSSGKTIRVVPALRSAGAPIGRNLFFVASGRRVPPGCSGLFV